MVICAVHIEVLQKSKTVCFTSCSKGTYVILPLSKSDDPVFLLKTSFSCPATHTLRAERYSNSQEQVEASPRLRQRKLTCGPFAEALDWSQGKPSRTVKQTDGNKRLFWCEEESVTSAPQADVATELAGGAKSCWGKVQFAVGADAQFVHGLPSVWRAGWRRERAGRQISQPNCVRIQKYLRGGNCILIHCRILQSSELYRMA